MSAAEDRRAWFDFDALLQAKAEEAAGAYTSLDGWTDEELATWLASVLEEAGRFGGEAVCSELAREHVARWRRAVVRAIEIHEATSWAVDVDRDREGEPRW